MKIRIEEVRRVDEDTTRVVLDVDHRPGAERTIAGLAEDVRSALDDGRITLWEALGIIAKTAGV